VFSIGEWNQFEAPGVIAEALTSIYHQNHK